MICPGWITSTCLSVTEESFTEPVNGVLQLLMSNKRNSYTLQIFLKKLVLNIKLSVMVKMRQPCFVESGSWGPNQLQSESDQLAVWLGLLFFQSMLKGGLYILHLLANCLGRILYTEGCWMQMFKLHPTAHTLMGTRPVVLLPGGLHC